jgi:two-component system chemotaxis sensor kinase CheA
MSLSSKVREQLLSSFRAELSEHVQTMTDGLLALEQGTISDEERQPTLEDIFRAAHSLKGASRAMGVTAVEQIAHVLESVLDGIRRESIETSPELYNACYQALDTIQAVQAAYEAGATTPPPEALKALADLEPFRHISVPAPIPEPVPPPAPEPAPKPVAEKPTPTPPSSTPTPTTEAPARAPIPDETIRVSVSKLDALMGQLSELLITKIRAEQRAEQVTQIQEFIALWQREWLTARSSFNRISRHDFTGNGFGDLTKDLVHMVDYLQSNQTRLQEISGLVSNLTRQYANDTMHMSLVVDSLEEEVKRVRMLPLSTITGPFPRMVRDLARAAGKEARLQIVGANTELDKRVLEQIKDPIIHLLRNAVDHGIEHPDKREAAGKPKAGLVTLVAEQLGKDVVICVSDDGGGLNLPAIRKAVARRSSIDPDLISEAELVEAIFSTGISTNPIITDISGRGVGLDIVRRNIEALHGRYQVDWKPGHGCTFTLTIPLALTSSHGLFVNVSGQTLAIPLNTIEHIQFIDPNDITSLEGQDTIRYNGEPISLVRLSDVLNLPTTTNQHDNEHMLAVILSAAERRMAFTVDELVGEKEVVIKGLGRQLSRVGGIAGATVMGSGDVVLILNAADLIKLALRDKRRSILDIPAIAVPTKVARAQQSILIVDDSITTRTLEKNILEAAGYSIQLATDGQEALTAIAAGEVPDLVVSDVAMPRVNGFELTRRIKEDPRTAAVPVILVTSLDSAADKARGIEAGADAYITKGTFDQSNLLETIEQLI